MNNVAKALPILQVVGTMVIVLIVTGVLVAFLIEAIKKLITEERIKKTMSLQWFAFIVNILFAVMVFIYFYVFCPDVFIGYEMYKVIMIFIGFLVCVFIASQLGYNIIVQAIKNLIEGKEPNSNIGGK